MRRRRATSSKRTLTNLRNCAGGSDGCILKARHRCRLPGPHGASPRAPMYGNCSCSLSSLTYERNLTSPRGVTPEFGNEITSTGSPVVRVKLRVQPRLEIQKRTAPGETFNKIWRRSVQNLSGSSSSTDTKPSYENCFL